jgi:hypothetical protein
MSVNEPIQSGFFDINEPGVLVPRTSSYAGEVLSWRPLRLTSKDFDIVEPAESPFLRQKDEREPEDTV